jgi:protease-4
MVFASSAAVIWYLAVNGDRGDVTEGSFLKVPLSGALSEAPVMGSFLEPDSAPLLVTEISGAIRAAADDERIGGLFLDMNMPSGGLGLFQELRDAVEDFRASGKPCVAYSEAIVVNYDYYLASACDVVLLAESGATMANGLSFQLTYYKGTLDKLGIEPEYEHVGDFKSAIETYERTEPSDEAREAMEYLADGLYEQLVAGIAEGRGMTEEEVRALFDRPPMSPAVAVERGMIDGLAFPDQMRARAWRYGEEGWLDGFSDLYSIDDDVGNVGDHYTPVREYVKEMRTENQWKDEYVAVVHAQGSILSGGGQDSLFGSTGLTDGKFRRWMRAARKDDAVQAVVVRVDSPGGSGLASQMMWREVALTKQAGKPVVVSFVNYAASGGYFMSANADWIVSQPGTITGSIGVFGGKFDLSGAYEQIGMTETVIKRGELADMLSFSSPFSEQGREVFREYLASFYTVFLDTVADGRAMTRDEVHEVAQGRVWTGLQAIDRGLVDELGGLDTAVAKARELAEMGDDHGLKRFPVQKTFFEALFDDDTSMSSSLQPRVELLDELAPLGLQEELELMHNVQMHGGVFTYLPGNPRFR